MPYVRLTLSRPDIDADTQQELARTVTELLAQDFAKNPDITVVQVELVPTKSWFVGSQAPSGVGGHMVVSLSTGINTDVEKATFIDHAYAELQRLVGPLAPIFYIEVHEIPGKSWGYNGVPQADRTLEED